MDPFISLLIAFLSLLCAAALLYGVVFAVILSFLALRYGLRRALGSKRPPDLVLVRLTRFIGTCLRLAALAARIPLRLFFGGPVRAVFFSAALGGLAAGLIAHWPNVAFALGLGFALVLTFLAVVGAIRASEPTAGTAPRDSCLLAAAVLAASLGLAPAPARADSPNPGEEEAIAEVDACRALRIDISVCEKPVHEAMAQAMEAAARANPALAAAVAVCDKHHIGNKGPNGMDVYWVFTPGFEKCDAVSDRYGDILDAMEDAILKNQLAADQAAVAAGLKE